MNPLLGIHHVTAITGNAQRNLDFYAGLLGMRFVKQTVNFDDPTSPHFYYGDETGGPGTLLTFFVMNHLARGRVGTPQAVTTALSVPAGSESFWADRLTKAGVTLTRRGEHFGEQFLAFTDPDGMTLELAFTNDTRPGGPAKAELSADVSVRGVYSVTLSTRDVARTREFLTATMGTRQVEATGPRTRFAFAGGKSGAFVDLLSETDLPRGLNGAGVVHHVAFRVADDAGELAWREKLIRVSANVSPVMDRNYFHSIYFHEPGGVLFEIATDGPGMEFDEPIEALGRKLVLPEQYEPHRKSIEGGIPAYAVP